MPSTVIRVLTDEDVVRALSMTDAISLMREAFVELSSGAARVPVRTRIDADSGSRALFMPSYLPSRTQFGLKTVTVQERNGQVGLPTIHGLMTLFDAETGRVLAVMNAEALTGLRTGAASGLATDLLSRDDASSVAIFGTGTQAERQLEAVASVRRIKRAVVFSRSIDRAKSFARMMGDRLGLPVEAAISDDQLLDADIICTATDAISPLFSRDKIQPGVHINAVGSYRPDMIEIPPGVVRSALVVVDHRESCLAEAGELTQTAARDADAESLVHAELGQIASGAMRGRTASTDVTLFKSVGNAVQDLVGASRIFEVAVDLDLGVEVSL